MISVTLLARMAGLYLGLICAIMPIGIFAGSEGTRFAFSFPRTYYDYTTELRITGRTETKLTITTDGFLYMYDLPAGGSITHKGDSSDRVTSGLENKGFELTSDDPVTVTIGSSSHDATTSPDDFLVRPLTSNDTEFFVISFLGSTTSDYYFPQSFFTITAADDNTTVFIFDNDGESYSEQILDKFQVYTVDAFDNGTSSTDYTGYSIISDKPVSVSAGHGYVHAGYNSYQYIMDSIPNTSDLGLEYTTLPVGFGNVTDGFYYRVVATEDNTWVTVPNLSQRIRKGAYVEGEIEYIQKTAKIHCTNPCVVVQVTENEASHGDMYQAWAQMGDTMTVLTPDEDLSTDLMFVTPELTEEQHLVKLSVIVSSEATDSLYLNGDKLNELAFMETDMINRFTQTTISLSQDTVYNLLATNPNQSFSAHLHTTNHGVNKEYYTKACNIGYDGTASTHFMLALPPSYNSVAPYIVISSQVETNVTLRQEQVTWEIYIPAGGATNYTLSTTDRVTSGVETKAFEITSDVPVTVYLGSNRHASAYTPDDILMKPINDDDTEFVITSYLGESMGTTRPGSFFMIIPEQTGTRVDVSKYEDDIWVEQFSEVIHKFQVLTHDSYDSSNRYDDFTGWRVKATHPIAVISGHGYAYFGGQYQHVCDSLPSKAASATEYLTFPVVLGIDSTFYRLRIVSAEDDVTVTIPELGIAQRIPDGGFVEIDSESLTSMMRISCSSPCVVAQFTMDAWFNAARTRTGGSMVTLTPLDQFSNEQIFQTSYLDSMYSIAVLVITVNQYPVEGLYINNQTLDNYPWKRHEEFASTAYEIYNGETYRLYTDNQNLKFVGYMMTAYQRIDTSYSLSATSCNIGYGTSP